LSASQKQLVSYPFYQKSSCVQ